MVRLTVALHVMDAFVPYGQPRPLDEVESVPERNGPTRNGDLPGQCGVAVVSATQNLLRFGVFELNLDTEELRKNGAVVRLPPQPLRLLALLASHGGRVVKRTEIQERLWKGETYVDFDHGVNKCINRIRRALGDNSDNPVYVATLPRQGYRFIAPVISKVIAAPRPRVVESDSGEQERTAVSKPTRRRRSFRLVLGLGVPGNRAATPDAQTAGPASAVPPTQKLRSWFLRARREWIGLAVPHRNGLGQRAKGMD